MSKIQPPLARRSFLDRFRRMPRDQVQVVSRHRNRSELKAIGRDRFHSTMDLRPAPLTDYWVRTGQDEVITALESKRDHYAQAAGFLQQSGLVHESPINDAESKAAMIFQLFMGSPDVEKNIPVAANFLLSHDDPVEVLKIVQSQLLPFAAIPLLWAKVFSQADPRLSAQFIVNCIDYLNKDSEFPFNLQWVCSQLAWLGAVDVATLIHEMVLQDCADRALQTLNSLQINAPGLQLEVLSLLHLNFPEVYSDPREGDGFTDDFIKPLSTGFGLDFLSGKAAEALDRRNTQEIEGFFPNPKVAQLFSAQAKIVVVRNSATFDQLVHWGQVGENLQTINDPYTDTVIEKWALEVLSEALAPYGLIVCEQDQCFQIYTKAEEGSLTDEPVLEDGEPRVNFTRVKDKHFVNAITRQFINYINIGAYTYAFYVLKDGHPKTSREIIKLTKTKDMAEVMESALQYRHLAEFFQSEMKYAEQDMAYGFKLLEALSQTSKPFFQGFIQFLWCNSHYKDLLREMLLVSTLSHDDLITNYRKAYDAIPQPRAERVWIEEFVIQVSPRVNGVQVNPVSQRLQAYSHLMQELKNLYRLDRSLLSAQLLWFAEQIDQNRIPSNILKRVAPLLALFIIRMPESHKMQVRQELTVLIHQLQRHYLPEQLKIRLEAVLINYGMPHISQTDSMKPNVLYEMVKARNENSRLALKHLLKMNYRQFGGLDLSDFDLRNYDLYKAKFVGTKLLRANLAGADLREAKLQQADLTGANLWSCRFHLTRVDGTKFNKAWFDAKTFKGFVFDNRMSFDGTQFDTKSFALVAKYHKDFTGANLFYVKHFRDIDLRGVQIDVERLLKDNLIKHPFWGTCFDLESFMMFYNAGFRDFRGAIFDGIDFRGPKLTEPLVIEGVDFDQARFDKANLGRLQLKNCRFTNIAGLQHITSFPHCYFSVGYSGTVISLNLLHAIRQKRLRRIEEQKRARGGKVNYVKSGFLGVKLDGMDLKGQNLEGLDLGHATFVDAQISLRGVAGCRLVENNWQGASLEITPDDPEEPFVGTELDRESLSFFAYKKLKNFKGASLKGADLNHIRLPNFNMADVDFTGANLSKARLIKVNLRGAVLVDVNLDGMKINLKDFQDKPFEGTTLDAKSYQWFYNKGVRDFRGAILNAITLQGLKFGGANTINMKINWVDKYEEGKRVFIYSLDRIKADALNLELFMRFYNDKIKYQNFREANVDLTGFDGMEVLKLEHRHFRFNLVLPQDKSVKPLEGCVIDQTTFETLFRWGIRDFRGVHFKDYPRGLDYYVKQGADLTGAMKLYLENVDGSYVYVPKPWNAASSSFPGFFVRLDPSIFE